MAIIRHKNMGKNTRQFSLPGLRKPFLLLIIIPVVLLSGCNLPGGLPTQLPHSPQQQTKIAGILNPPELTPPANPPEPTPPANEPAPTSTPQIVLTPEPQLTAIAGFFSYTTQQGDTLPALASRFGVSQGAIQSILPLPETGYLPVGLQVQVPDVLADLLPIQSPLLPDSEVIYGPSVNGFDAGDFAREAGGFLATYSELVKGQVMTGPEIIHWVALETSTNPRLLLAFLEYRSGWVFGHPAGASTDRFPIGYGANDTGLYNELMITAKLLAQGFYGWRTGQLTELTFYGGSRGRLSPGLNAGSAAVMHLFATLYEKNTWMVQMNDPGDFLVFYQEMFGDFWARALEVEPYLLATTTAPELTLPFTPGEAWALTGGPHITWQTGTPLGALDFAPITGEPACVASAWWATAAAPGLVVRSERGVVALDLDGDGDEGTGWVMIYLHMAAEGRAPVGTWLNQDDRVGHPSCEGGSALGTHLHFARKFNGEWVGVEEPLPLVLSGWRAVPGERRYEGFLIKGDQTVTSRPNGSSGSTIIREE